MRDKLEGNETSERSRAKPAETEVAKRVPEKPRRKAETPMMTDELTGKFLRVGDKLYRTSDDKKPIVRLEPDRLKTSNIDALPDIMRIAKANGWTSIKINGGETFRKAAYLAAASQGLEVENYTPSPVLRAEANRLRARLTKREDRRSSKESHANMEPSVDGTNTRKALAERFLAQSNAQNARDPELRRAQTLVAQALSIARARFPDDPAKASKDVEARRHQIAERIIKGDPIAAIQIRNQQKQPVREAVPDHSLKRSGPPR